MTKTIYLIDPETGDLLGESPHPLDPVETERAGKPVYALLNPLLATEMAPPKIRKGKKAVWVDGAWTLHPLPAPPEPELPAAGPPPPPVPAPPTFEERLALLRAHISEYMDAMARSRGYDDIKTAVTYAEEPAVPRFQIEGQAFRAWRSKTWAACEELLARVRAGEAEEPTKDTIAHLLPTLELPAPEAPPEAQETTR